MAVARSMYFGTAQGKVESISTELNTRDSRDSYTVAEVDLDIPPNVAKGLSAKTHLYPARVLPALPGFLEHQIDRQRDDVVHEGDRLDRANCALHPEAVHSVRNRQ